MTTITSTPNRYQTHYLLVVLAIALGVQLIMLPIVNAETGKAETGNVETAGEGSLPDTDDKNDGLNEEDSQTPFAYWAPDDSRAFIPSASAEIPPGIKLVGVIIVKGQKTIAAVTVPGYNEPFYVSEKDVIGIPAAGSGKFSNSKMNYIEIGSIGKRQIKLFPRANPRNIQILQ